MNKMREESKTKREKVMQGSWCGVTLNLVVILKRES